MKEDKQKHIYTRKKVDMKMKFIVLYCLINLVLIITFYNIYDWEGQYFVITLINYLYINIMVFVLGFLMKGMISNFLSDYAALASLAIGLFLFNEVSYKIIEGNWAFFGLFNVKQHANIVPIDWVYSFLLSSTGVLSGIISLLICIRGKKKSSIIN